MVTTNVHHAKVKNVLPYFERKSYTVQSEVEYFNDEKLQLDSQKHYSNNFNI